MLTITAVHASATSTGYCRANANIFCAASNSFATERGEIFTTGAVCNLLDDTAAPEALVANAGKLDCCGDSSGADTCATGDTMVNEGTTCATGIAAAVWTVVSTAGNASEFCGAMVFGLVIVNFWARSAPISFAFSLWSAGATDGPLAAPPEGAPEALTGTAGGAASVCVGLRPSIDDRLGMRIGCDLTGVVARTAAGAEAGVDDDEEGWVE